MRSPLAQLALFVLLHGCARDVELVGEPDGGAPSSNDDLGGAGCPGASIRLERDGVEQCAAALVASAHRYALCSCGSLEAGGTLETHAFDSTGLTAPDDTTAAVGVNGTLAASVELDIGGAVYAASWTPVEDARISESLHLGGALSIGSAAEVQVGTEAYIAGDVSGVLAVQGTLHVPASATVDSRVVAASIDRSPVGFAPPCDCTPSSADVAKAVAAAAEHNDNASIDLAPRALVGAAATDELTLPCGTYRVDAIDSDRDLTLTVQGRTALVVAGDVTLRRALNVTLAAGAELDLFIGGRLSATGGASLGNKSAPARVRIWIAGAGPVLFENHPVVGAQLHAALAAVSAPQGLELYGGLLGQTIHLGEAASVHFDRAVLSGGISCGAPAQLAVH